MLYFKKTSVKGEGSNLSLYQTLYPYQKNIVDKFKDKERYGLFLDCGLGKTLVSLAFTEVNKCTKVIVVSINAKAEEDINVGGSWMWWGNRSDIKYNFYNKKIFHPTKKKPNNFTNETNDFLLLNFESLYARNTEKFSLKPELIQFIKTCKGHNTAIVVDESHSIKNISSSRFKAVNMIVNMCKMFAKKTYLYIGTGTLFTSGLEDIYAQIKILGWDGTKTQFLDRYCVRGDIHGLNPWEQPIVAYQNVDELYEVVHKYGITIKSEDVLELPEQIFIYHTQEQSDEFFLLAYDKLKMNMINAELKLRGLPYIISDDIYDKFSLEEKLDYWSKFRIDVDEEGTLNLDGSYPIGSLFDTYTTTMNFLATIYENIDYLGAFEFLRDFYYMFVMKEEKGTKKKWYEARPYKPNKLMNNPFYRNFTFPQEMWDAETSGALWMRARQMSVGFQGNSESYIWYDYTRLNMLRQLLESHEDNYVLFYNYVPEYLEVYKLCQELGYKIDVYNGQEKSLTYYNEYENQSEGERMLNTKNIIISNFKSGSTGKNWQLYNKCIIFSTPIYSEFVQGLKRIHRNGQKSTCVYHMFCQNNWLDNGMKESLDKKQDYTDDMFQADLKRLHEMMEKDDDES